MAGKKGRSGGKPFELTERARGIVERYKLLDVAGEIASRAQKDADRLNAIRFLVEYAYGKAVQPIAPPAGQRFTLTFGDSD